MLLLTIILLFLVLYSYIKNDIMKLYCVVIIIFVTCCYVSNEVLSAFYKLDKIHLSGFYFFLNIGLFLVLLYKWRIRKEYLLLKSIKKCADIFRNNKLGIVFSVFFILMFFLAIFTIPYNWDSMTYHLPRIVQWEQNRSVAHYATCDVRRVTSPVLPAFINLQAYILSDKNDSIFNLLQYSSFVTNAILIYQICKKLNVEKKNCWLAMLLFVSMPISFGEAISTQVDQFSTMWLLMFVFLLLDLLREDYLLSANGKTVFDVVLLSVCIAYGYLAKPSIMFGIMFFALWLLMVSIKRKDNIRIVFSLIGVAVIIIVVIVSPEVIRNIITFGKISDPIAGKRQMVETLNPLYLLVNGLMNYTMNLPNIFINWKEIIEFGVYWVAYVLRVDITSPTIAEDGVKFYLHEAARYNHDTAINPTIVLASTLVFLWVLWKKLKKERLTFNHCYIIISMAAFSFFCCVVKWEPFVTRYMLSYLALLCPAVAIWLTEMKKKDFSKSAYAILVFVSVCELINLSSYHFDICKKAYEYEDRVEGYFVVNEGEKQKYIELKKELEKLECEGIGLYLSMAATYEYPIWKMVDSSVHIESILVDNQTGRYEDAGFIPDYIVVINQDGNDIVNYKMQKYSCYKQIDENFAIYEREKA